MKNQFKKRMLNIMMMSTMMVPGFSILPEEGFEWELKESKQTETISVLTTPDGKGKQGYAFVSNGQKGFVEERDALVFTDSNKNELITITETFIGTGIDGKVFYNTNTRYEFHITEQLIAEEATETQIDENARRR